MSSTEANLNDEKQSQEEADVTSTENKEIKSDNGTVDEDKLSLEELPNASVMSASEIRSPVDETRVEASPSDTVGSGSGEEGGEGEAKEEKETAVVDETSNGGEEGWEDILGNGQLMKKVLRKGAGLSTRPTQQSRVKLRTRGFLDNGKAVDRHSSVLFTVGDGDVLQAWDLTAPLMEKGEVAKLKTNSRFAYGSLGKLPDIPPDANITYELELLDVQPPLSYDTLSEEELLKLVDQKRVRGNELFQRKEYDRAIHSYQKGLKMIEDFLEESGRESKLVQEMQIRCWNNIAAAQLKVNLHKEALESCEDVLKKDPSNVKALFRAGKVLSIMGEMDEAVRKLEKAKSLDPEERAIQVELEKAIQKRKISQEKERRMYQRMMEGEKPAKPASKLDKASLDGSWGPLPYLAVAAIIASIGIGLAYFITQKH